MDELIAAYEDAQSVTARLIGNILVRLNREASADFDILSFFYAAQRNAEAARIDMLPVSDREQTVDLHGARRGYEVEEPIMSMQPAITRPIASLHWSNLSAGTGPILVEADSPSPF